MSSKYDELASQLKSQDAKLRFSAVEALVTLQEDEATDLLLPVLQSRNEALVHFQGRLP